MIKINCALLLFLAAVAAKQDDIKTSPSKTSKPDQEVSNDQVTSILVQPGPDGPRHVILASDHQVISSPPVTSSFEGISSRAVNYKIPYHTQAEEVQFHRTIPPPLPQVTYGPAQPVVLRRGRPEQQLYHNPFQQRGKITHSKAPPPQGEQAVYKYSTYIKHDKVKELGKDIEKGYYSSHYVKPDSSIHYGKPDSSVNYGKHDSSLHYVKSDYGSHPGKPDYSVVAETEPHQKSQYEGLSKYRNRDEEEEIKFRESIGDLYNHNDFEKSSEYDDKKQRPLHFPKLYTKQNNYVPNNVEFVPNKNIQSQYNTFDNDAYQHDAPSGFDDYNGGKVVPVLAKFYKQPLPIIQTQLPVDNVGLFIQYFPHTYHQRSGYEKEEVSNNYFDQYPREKYSLKRESPSSEWTPINAPDGAVPAKAYDIPAPDLSLVTPVGPQKVYRRDSEDASVVVGKNKQKIATSNQHIQNNSEGVVSAVVRVKQ